MKQLLLLLAVCSAFVAAGCGDVGDTNPVSPEKMEEIRNKTNNERANFNPGESRGQGQ